MNVPASRVKMEAAALNIWTATRASVTQDTRELVVKHVSRVYLFSYMN